MKAFERLLLWIDPEPRPGPEAMAVDDWLLETAVEPVLRVYGWSGDWGSLGYFGLISEARAAFPGLPWVRRRTGGGLVDHRADWTYSVIAPGGSLLASLPGAESYRIVHQALADVLNAEGVCAVLSDGGAGTGSAACFENPVGHDLVGANGCKLAGAGQRRGRRGLLHQGSVALPCEARNSEVRGARLADALASEWCKVEWQPPSEWIREAVRERYGRDGWTLRR